MAIQIPKFSPGRIVATPGALESLRDSEQGVRPFLRRHLYGDWGDVCSADKQANDRALMDGSRLLSAYSTAKGERLWVITEAVGDDGKREATTFLLPSEY